MEGAPFFVEPDVAVCVDDALGFGVASFAERGDAVGEGEEGGFLEGYGKVVVFFGEELADCVTRGETGVFVGLVFEPFDAVCFAGGDESALDNQRQV